MALEIPEQDTGSIAVMKSLPIASLDKLVAALKAAPVVSNSHEMARHIAKKVPSFRLEQLTAVLDTLYSLYYIRELSGVKHPRFIDDLIDGIQNNPRLQSKPRDLSKLRSMLEKLMDIDTLNTVSKAARLQRDGERLYCDAKVLSDIRPVFGRDPTVPPVGAVLTHTLRVGYHEGSDHKEFHVILDSDDLMALAGVIFRAQSKDKALRVLLKGAKLPNLGE